MKLKSLNIFAYSLLPISACVTVYFVHGLSATNTEAYILLSAWLLLPHIVMAVRLAQAQRNPRALLYWLIASAIVPIGGVVFLADILYWNSDPQGGIALILTPIYQGGAMLAIILFVDWLTSDK